MSARLTEDVACGALMLERHRRALCLPRYTPPSWWECDVLELTGSGYFREYEVKLTVADFKADAAKRMEKRPWAFGTAAQWENKHALLAAGDPRGPVEFSFVVPEGLIAQEMLPPWAGLIELRDRGEGHRPTFRWTPHTVVKAPRLHDQKANEKLRKDILGVCYYRLHVAMQSIRDNTEPRATWVDEAPPAQEVAVA